LCRQVRVWSSLGTDMAEHLSSPTSYQVCSDVMSFDHLARKVAGGTMALTEASGRIRAGEFVAVVGPSGSGKTTLLSILGLLDRPTNGTYTLAGMDVTGVDDTCLNRLRAEKIGFVFQNSFLIAEQTVGENTALGLKVRGIPPRLRKIMVVEALGRVGLADAVDKRGGDLSGGERQRVAVARALVTRPEVILADEPTGALDSASTERLIDVLKQINNDGTTIIVVTHDPLVAAAAHRRISIVDGVVHDLPTDEAPHVVPRPAASPASRPSSLAGNRIGRTRQELADAMGAPLTRPVRALLVVMAYTLGVMALVAAMGVMNSTTGQIVARLTQAGSTELRVTATTARDQLWSDSLTQAHAIAGVQGVTLAAPVREYAVPSNTITRVEPGGNYRGHILVTSHAYLQAYGLQTATGQPDLLDNPWSGPVVVAGSAAADALGLVQASPGISILVNGRPVDLIAIMAETHDPILDDTLYFSAAAMTYLSDQIDNYTLVHFQPGYAEPLAQAIPLVLAAASPGQIKVSTIAELSHLQQGINSDMSTQLTIIGWVILALSTLTASTTMFLSIQHRRAEIALRRAMGASRRSIWRLFTYEGIMIGCVGGGFGIGLGVALTTIVAHVNNWPLCVGVETPLVGLLTGVVAGAVASVIPAISAATQDSAGILRTV